MKGYKYWLLSAAVLVVGFSSCVKDKPPAPVPSETEQTLFIYMPWSGNGVAGSPNELTSSFRVNLRDFETAMRGDILGNNRVVVFFSSSPTEAEMFELKYRNGAAVRQTIETYTNPDFTTAAGITAILRDAVSAAPAKRYAMVVGCHGMGWLPVTTVSKARGAEGKPHWEYEGVPKTRYFGGTAGRYQTDVTTFADGIAGAGLKMEYILFDDCYMSSIEVAYDLRHVTERLIASPTEIMAHGYPYDLIAQHLIRNDYRAICRGFYDFYTKYDYPYGTIGMIECAEVEALAAIMRRVNAQYTFDGAKLAGLQRMDGYTPVIFFDLMDYVAALCPSDTELYAEFAEQFDRAVPASCRLHTPYYYSMSLRVPVEIVSYSGVTISDPTVNATATFGTPAASKTATAWYRDTH